MMIVKALAVVLCVGEILKLIICDWQAKNLPFYFSSIVIATITIVAFSKKKSLLFESAYSISLSIFTVIFLLILVSPREIFAESVDNIGSSYLMFWRFASHVIDVFIFIWIIFLIRIKLSTNAIFYGSITTFLVAGFIEIVSWSTNVDFDKSLWYKEWWWTIIYMIGTSIIQFGIGVWYKFLFDHINVKKTID
jgi:hypothetical protein